MKFNYYLFEIKNRLILLVIAFIFCLLISYSYKETLLFLTVKNLNDSNKQNFIYFISTSVTELMVTYLRLSYINSILLSSHLFIYHLLMFFHPALNTKEYILFQKYLINNCFFNFFCYIILNYYLMPFFFNFFFNFQNLCSIKTINIYFENKLEEYINLYFKIWFLLLIINQFLIFFFITIKFIKNKTNFIKQSKKLCYLIFITFSTIITPPDIFSQLLFFSVFILLLEILILIIIFQNNLVRKPIKT